MVQNASPKQITEYKEYIDMFPQRALSSVQSDASDNVLCDLPDM